MRTVLVGTINVSEVENELRAELYETTEAIKKLVNDHPFGEHTKQDLDDYLDLRKKQESLKAQLL